MFPNTSAVTEIGLPQITARVLHGITCIVGIIFNVTVIVLALNMSALKGKVYRIFIINLAVIDIMYYTNYVVTTIFLSQNPLFCVCGGFLTLLFGVAMMQGTVPVVFNRYIGICRPKIYVGLFTKPKIAMICAYPYALGLGLGVVFSNWIAYGVDKYDIVCVVRQNGPALFALCIISQTWTYGVLFYCTYHLYWKFEELKTAQQNLELTEKMKETRFLLKAAVFQAISPLPLQLPAFMFVFLDFDVSTTTQIGWSVVNTFYIATGLFDAIGTLFIIKPFRKKLQQLWMRARSTPQNSVVPYNNAMYNAPPKPDESWKF